VTYVLAHDSVNDIVRRSTKELGNDGELVDVVLSGEKGLALKHLSEDAAGTPNVNLHIVLLPGEHDLGRAVISRRDVAGHLRILDTGQTEIANLQIAVLVDQNVARLQISMDDTGGMNVF
jgi:hypothetical protein